MTKQEPCQSVEGWSIFDCPFVDDLYGALAGKVPKVCPSMEYETETVTADGFGPEYDVAIGPLCQFFEHEGWQGVTLKRVEGTYILDMAHPPCDADMADYGQMPWVKDHRLNAYMMVWNALSNTHYYVQCCKIAPCARHSALVQLWWSLYEIMRAAFEKMQKADQWQGAIYQQAYVRFLARSHEAERLEGEPSKFFLMASEMHTQCILCGIKEDDEIRPLPGGEGLNVELVHAAQREHGPC